MSALLQAQAKFKQDHNLQKIKVVRNKNYKASGPKSYVYLLDRFGFQPTKPGPYCHEKSVEQTGLAQAHIKVGGRARFSQTLVKKESPDTAGPTSGPAGQVTAEDQQSDSLYLCKVDVGTPPQTLMLDFDTGSSDLWVFSTELPASSRKNHSSFDPEKSSTWKALPGYTWSIGYADKSAASGNVGTDVINLGGLSVENQAVELAQKLTKSFIEGTGDGLLGLGWPSINTIHKNGTPDPQATVVTNMISQKDIPVGSELFTSAFYSSRDSGDPESFYTFGWIDQDLVKASGKEIAWTPIDNSKGFWQFPSTTATINGKKTQRKGNTAIADTGTTLALLSDDVVDALYAAIPGAKYSNVQQGYIFPIKSDPAKLPKFSVAVGDTEFVIQPEDFAFTPVDDVSWYGAIQSRGNNKFDILGDAFLKSVYAIWDQGETRIGFVPKIQKTQNLTPVEDK